jgi:GrpB-like predicted nucleotidyltransferase (UPF0157 family)
MNETDTPQRDMANVPYDPEWPAIFQKLKEIISQAYPKAIGVEHIGSTAIPEMSAKPRIDLDVVIADEAELPDITAALESLGYYSQGDRGHSGREAFGRKDDHVPYDGKGTAWIKHNLYVCPHDSAVLHEHLVFRNYLRTYPEAAEEYVLLKNKLSREFRHDQKAYIAGKT